MAKIEIDGKAFEVANGSTIIEAADANNVYIPRFCYHKKLSVAANCRMCLVEVEKAPKTLPACATPVTEGMKIFTKSQKTIDSQKAVMEFLLINHPLDCPVCDQGGQCELQDLAMGYGADLSAYDESKRAVSNKEIGPLVATEMTRCIHCTRCVRFGDEVAGLRELGLVNRGGHAEIGTYVKHTMQSELSGNIVDLCPVGALTSKPFRFAARAWEMNSFASVAPHDCVGSNVMVNTLRHDVKRVLPRENAKLNEVWLSDRDRFSYTALEHEQRLLKPMIKRNGEWYEAEWKDAFDVAYKGLKVVIDENPAYLGALLSPSSTTEEAYLLQKFMRAVGSNNVDHRLRAGCVADQQTSALYPAMAISVDDIEKQNAIFLIGSNIRHEQPILGLRVRKAFLKGAKIFGMNVYQHPMHFHYESEVLVQPKAFARELAAVLKAACEIKGETTPQICKQVEVTPVARTIAQGLIDAENAALILGIYLEAHPHAGVLRALAKALSEVTGASFNPMTRGANSQGAHIAGATPHRAEGGQPIENMGLDTNAMLKAELAGFVLLNVEPELDCADQHQALAAMQQAGFVVAMTAFVNENMKQYADVLLPVAPFTETSGTFVNIEGQWQSFRAAAPAKGEARPAWKVLRVLANVFECEGFDYASSADILADVKKAYSAADVPVSRHSLPESLPEHAEGLQLVMMPPMYAVDSLVRRAEPLSKLVDKDERHIVVNSATAKKNGMNNGHMARIVVDKISSKLKVSIDERLPNDTVKLASGLSSSAGFGRAYALIEVEV